MSCVSQLSFQKVCNTVLIGAKPKDYRKQNTGSGIAIMFQILYGFLLVNCLTNPAIL